MKKEIKAIPDLIEGTIIYVFERGECTYLSNRGWDEKYKSEIYEVKDSDGLTIRIPAYNCFELKSYSRIWTMGDSAIKLVCGTAYNFRTFAENVGKTGRVVYGVKGEDYACDEVEIFNAGDLLPIAWRGRGIEFSWLIDRWLRRLEGEVISNDDEYCSI